MTSYCTSCQQICSIRRTFYPEGVSYESACCGALVADSLGAGQRMLSNAELFARYQEQSYHGDD